MRGAPVDLQVHSSVVGRLVALSGISQRAFAEKVKTSHNTINQIVTGQRPSCDDELAMRIEDALGVSRGALFRNPPAVDPDPVADAADAVSTAVLELVGALVSRNAPSMSRENVVAA